MPLFHTCVDTATHYFKGMQSLVITGTPEEVQGQLNDFMRSPDHGDIVVYGVNVASNPTTMTTVVLYGTFAKKQRDYKNNTDTYRAGGYRRRENYSNHE